MSNNITDINQDRFEELLQKDQTQASDNERKALFHIISGNDDLYNRVNHIYDFKKHGIRHDLFSDDRPDYLPELASSSGNLLKLGFNLYNSRNKADVFDTFSNLDRNNFELAIQAIRIRFGK